MIKTSLVASLLLFGISQYSVGQIPQIVKGDDSGVSLSFFLSSENAKSLYNLVTDHMESFPELFALKNNPKIIPPTQLSCKALLWKPLKGAETFSRNRIECTLDMSSSNQIERKLFIGLGQEEISGASLSVNPSFKFKGPLSNALVKLISQNENAQDFQKKYAIKKVKVAGVEAFILGNMDDRLPYLICSKNLEASCAYEWPKVETQSASVSLGDNGMILGKAACAKAASLWINGSCPSKWESVSYMQCSFQGLWVPHGTWGAIDASPQINCKYAEDQQDKNFQIPLGPVVTRPWGSKFGNPGIQIFGSELRNFYHVLKDYAVSHTKDQNAVEYMDFGSGQWGFQAASLRRYSIPEEMFSSLNCDVTDISYDSQLRVPHHDLLFERERYSCSIQTIDDI